MTIKQALESASATLLDSEISRDFARLGIEFRARLECEILLAHILRQERVFLHTKDSQNLDSQTLSEFFALVNRRSQGEPIEYLTKRASFYGRDFFVDYGALIPRTDSEILLQQVLKISTDFDLDFIAEVGVGSGALSCTLAMENPKLHIIASDISESALAIAQKNVQNFGLDSQILLVQSDLLGHFDSGDFNFWNLDFEDFDFGARSESRRLDSVDSENSAKNFARDSVDSEQNFTQDSKNRPKIPKLIFSNPPYISNSYALPKSVRYEPQNALFGGERGDEILQKLILDSQKLGVQFLLCEMGFDQLGKISEFVQNCVKNFQNLSFVSDLNGLDRAFILRFY